MTRVRISEQELYEICKVSISHSSMVDPIMFNSKLKHEVSKNFRMLTAMDRPSFRFSNKATNRLIQVAAVSFVLLTIKMGCEGYFHR